MTMGLKEVYVYMAGKVVRKTFYDKDFVPKNLEELYNSGWKDYMLYHIRKYSLHDINHSPEDLLQDMMVQLAEKHYIENYDPEINPEFTGYLHVFIRNFMSKPYNREHKSVHGSNIVNSVPIVQGGSADQSSQESNKSVVFDIPDSCGDFTNYVCLVESLENDLKEIKTRSKVDYSVDDNALPRTPLTVYNLLRDGYDIKEIAKLFGTSKQAVYTIRQKIFNVLESYG